MQVALEPLTAEAFAQYGHIVTLPAPDERKSLAAILQNLRPSASAILSLTSKRPDALPLNFPVMERHPYSSQAFLPLKASRYVVMSVTDTGTGIAPEVLERIFEPFFTTKKPESGTGLGLFTVAGIVRGHGGHIQVQSQPGQGSTFSVFLPAIERRVDAEARRLTAPGPFSARAVPSRLPAPPDRTECGSPDRPRWRAGPLHHQAQTLSPRSCVRPGAG